MSRKWMKGLSFLLTSILIAGMTACGQEKLAEEEPERTLTVVGFSQVGAESDWRVANTESMRDTFVESKGYELLFDNARQKQDNQIAAIRTFILQEVDYIVLAPIVEVGWEEVLQEAKDAEIPVIIADRKVRVEDDSLYTAWVGSDCRREGDTAMEWLETYLEEQGRADEEISIVHVMGTEGSTAQLGRTEGLDAGLAKHSNWKLAARLDGEFTQAKAYEEMADYLEQSDQVDVVYCENDNSAFGVIQALEKAGVSCGPDGDVIIISFDATEAGLRACMEGKISLDVECNPLHGPRVEAIIRQLEQGETPEKESYVEEQYFTREDLTEEFIESRAY